MEYTHFFENEISLLGLGCMRLPVKEAGKEAIDYDRAAEMVDAALKSGVNYFDTAYGYHDQGSEIFLGKTMRQYDRSAFHLATKLPSWYIKTEDDNARLFEEQLQKLQTDYFDFYLLHSVQPSTWEVFERNHSYDFIRKMREEGAIRHLGFSFHGDLPLLTHLLEDYDWEFVQLQINYYDWYNGSAREEYELVRKHGLPVIIMEPVMGGKLAKLTDGTRRVLDECDSGGSYASRAIRFAASLDGVMTVLSGMSDMAQLADNIQTLSPLEPLSQKDRDVIRRASEQFREYFAVPCTGCGYCGVCPKEIEIPKILSLYNQYNLARDREAFRQNYQAAAFSAGAQACIQCKKCMEFCPQEIKIPDLLGKISGLIGENAI